MTGRWGEMERERSECVGERDNVPRRKRDGERKREESGTSEGKDASGGNQTENEIGAWIRGSRVI
jgi:hypothetical protein